MNPSTPAPVKEEPKQEVIQAVDESPAQASEVVQCRNNECASFDGLCADNCSKLPIGEPEPVTACKGYKAEWPDEQAETVGLLDQDTAHVGNAIEQLESELQPATFNPLDEPLGDCEQCMGYGVVEGDLFGESTFIPCRCEAGIKVAGDKWAGPVTDGGTNPKYRKCCDECSIDDPDCSSCQLPDLEVSAQAEKPVPVIDKDRTCCMPLDRDWKEDNGNRVLFCRVCNLIHRLTDMDGKDLPFEIGTKYNLQPKTVAPEPAKPALTPLQLKCTHPSVFRTPVDGGFYCKCCKQTILSGGGQPGLSAVQPGAPR